MIQESSQSDQVRGGHWVGGGFCTILVWEQVNINFTDQVQIKITNQQKFSITKKLDNQYF